MPSISVPAAIIGTGAITAGAGIASGVMGANAAKSAANAQTAAANQASQTQLAMYQQQRADLSPFMSVGTSALSQLASIFGLAPPQVSPQAGVNGGSALAPGGMTDVQAQALLQARPDVMAEYQRASSTADHNSPAYLQAGLDSPLNYARHWFNDMGGSTSYQIPTATPGTPGAATLPAMTGGTPAPGAAGSQLSQLLQSFPGYQFGLDQGVQALDRSAASRGLTLSGGQMKDVQSFGTNYAMQQGWAPYISELNGLSSSGQNAAAGVGSAGVATGQGVAGSQLAAGQSTAAGTVGAANNYQTALQSALQGYQMYQNSGGGWGAAAQGATAGGINYGFGVGDYATNW